MDARTPWAGRRMAVLALSLALGAFVAGCGGSGDSSDSAAPQPAPTPAPVAFAAVGTSAATASLAWQAPADAATWTVERRSAGGAWAALGTVDARQGAWLDAGLAPATAYEYRLVRPADAGGAPSTVASASATTSDEAPVVTAAGSALAEPAAATLGAGGGRLAAADGRVALDVPAGAFAAATGASVQPVTNTAPGGRGHGLRVKLDAAPAAALKLTLRHEAEHDGVADGLRVAVQRADGSWLSLPLAARDKAARTLEASLPPSFFGAAAPAAARAAASAVSLEFTIVAYLAFELQPPNALVKVGTTLPLKAVARVRGYDTQVGTCVELDVDLRGCLMTPVMQTREIPFTNQKAGYERQWWVNAEVGGSASDGTVRPDGAVGAVYTAPAKVPNPETVRVSFVSKNLATGQQVVLTSLVSIYDDSFRGMLEAVIGPSIAGTTFFAKAEVTWRLDPATSASAVKEYVAEGVITLSVVDDDCTVTMNPTAHPIESPVPANIRLKVDERTVPASYSFTLATFWNGSTTGVCPKGSATREGLLGYGWEASGTLRNDDTLIEGVDFVEGGTITWSFER